MNAGRNGDTARQDHEPRCILVGTTAREGFTETPALTYAIKLATQCNATLSLYVFAPLPEQPWPMPADYPAAWSAQETERLAGLMSSTTHAASALIARAGVELVAEGAHLDFEPRDARFVQLARVNDIAVLDAAARTDSTQRMLVENALFDSGRSVMVIPRQGGNPRPKRIAIGWDGSARSARAVKDALPLLISAETVIAVTVTGEKDLSRMAPGADLAMYLSRYGVDCKLANLAGARGKVGSRLELFVAEEEIDMIVMGAFVHSRFREAVLGGVTRDLLDNPPVAVFLAH